MNTKKLGGSHIKVENRKLVFNHIFNQPGISRPQITSQTKLSAASVGRITDELLNQGLIKEYDCEAGNVGRRPTLLYVCGEKIPALSIELDRDKQVCAVVDLSGKVHYRIKRNFQVHPHSPDELCQLVQEMIKEIMNHPDLADKQFAGIGVALPGLIDLDTGMVRMSSQLRWHNVPLGAMLRNMFPDMTITIDNEMNARAFAESLYGEIRHEQNAVILGIGSGVGAGIVANKQVYRGSGNKAGEVGHVIMDPNGKMCECGRYGCLQTFVADWALVEDARLFKQDADIYDILQAANNGEQWAISIINRFVRYTKIAISYFTSLLDPGAVVLSGSLLENHPTLSEWITREYENQPQAPFRLTISGLGHDGAIVGAAAQLLHETYNEYL
ncbi:MAG: ROK family protein [Defluviitaleaceae bacterium]|nr:ROK family protein [Defluviitaleaceae bacterium]